MKVYDIICEAPSVILGPNGQPLQSPTPAAAPTTTPSTAAPSSSTPKKGLKKYTPASTPGSGILRRMATKAKRSQRRLDALEQKYSARFGTPLKILFRVVGITAAVIELYATLEQLEEEYTKGTPIEQDDGTFAPLSQARFETLRELAFGTFQVQVLVPVVVPWIARVAKTLFLVNWIKRVGALASAPVTAGVSVVAMLATEAGAMAFQTWLGSKAGQDWVLNSLFMEPIRLFGKLGDGAANGLTGLFSGKTSYEKADEKKTAIQGNQSAQALPPAIANRPAPPAPADNYDTDVRYTKGRVVYVGGQPVTDEQGFLDPRALDAIGVQSARYTAQSRGLEDPLKGIPQKPGNKPIKMLEPEKQEIPAGGDRRAATNKDAQAAWEKSKQDAVAGR